MCNAKTILLLIVSLILSNSLYADEADKAVPSPDIWEVMTPKDKKQQEAFANKFEEGVYKEAVVRGSLWALDRIREEMTRETNARKLARLEARYKRVFVKVLQDKFGLMKNFKFPKVSPSEIRLLRQHYLYNPSTASRVSGLVRSFNSIKRLLGKGPSAWLRHKVARFFVGKLFSKVLGPLSSVEDLHEIYKFVKETEKLRDAWEGALKSMEGMALADYKLCQARKSLTEAERRRIDELRRREAVYFARWGLGSPVYPAWSCYFPEEVKLEQCLKKHGVSRQTYLDKRDQVNAYNDIDHETRGLLERFRANEAVLRYMTRQWEREISLPEVNKKGLKPEQVALRKLQRIERARHEFSMHQGMLSRYQVKKYKADRILNARLQAVAKKRDKALRILNKIDNCIKGIDVPDEDEKEDASSTTDKQCVARKAARHVNTRRHTTKSKNGKVTAAYYYWYDTRHGPARTWYVSGKKHQRMTFYDGYLTGQYHSRYNNTGNSRKQSGCYRLGKASGKWTSWYEDGKTRKSVRTYLRGFRQGPAQYYFANGRKKSVTHYKDDMHHGAYRSWYDNPVNAKKSEGRHQRNKAEDKWTYWHPDGKTVSQTTHYRRGVKHGSSRTFFASGRKKVVTHYKDGNHHGLYTSYHDNAANNIRSRGQHEYNRATGLWSYWHANGRKSSSGYYRHGEKTGLWRYWDEKGKLLRQKRYK